MREIPDSPGISTPPLRAGRNASSRQNRAPRRGCGRVAGRKRVGRIAGYIECKRELPFAELIDRNIDIGESGDEDSRSRRGLGNPQAGDTYARVTGAIPHRVLLAAHRGYETLCNELQLVVNVTEPQHHSLHQLGWTAT